MARDVSRHEEAVPHFGTDFDEPVHRRRLRGGVPPRRRAAAGPVPDEIPAPALAGQIDRDTVIVATTAGGETLTSGPMPRLQAEMLLVLGVRGGTRRVRPTGIIRASLRDVPRADEIQGSGSRRRRASLRDAQ
jgi:hypothetical protein